MLDHAPHDQLHIEHLHCDLGVWGEGRIDGDFAIYNDVWKHDVSGCYHRWITLNDLCFEQSFMFSLLSINFTITKGKQKGVEFYYNIKGDIFYFVSL